MRNPLRQTQEDIKVKIRWKGFSFTVAKQAMLGGSSFINCPRFFVTSFVFHGLNESFTRPNHCANKDIRGNLLHGSTWHVVQTAFSVGENKP